MSSSDSRQSRYANTNANARRPGNWGADPAQYRPIGQRYGSVLVLSGPKRKQAGPTVRKPVPRPVNLPSQRKDRQGEGSLLGGKQSRAEDSTQSENTAQSLNSHTWHNSSGTWTAPQESGNRTDEYGFPIRSEAPINAREFPSLAASKQAPAGKKTTQQDQADAYFSLDDRDTLPPADGESFSAFGSRRDDRADSQQDWRSGRAETGSRDDEFEGVRAITGGRSNPDSRRGAFGFNATDTDRRNVTGGSAFKGRSGGSFGGRSTGARLEDYGMRPGSSPGVDKGSPGPRSGDDYVGPAAQVLGASNTIISSTLLASSVAGPASAAQGEEEEEDQEDEELQRHYKELEAIKQEEEEKDRQRALAAEAGSVDGAEESGTWEDAAADDDQMPANETSDDALGLKPIDHEKWQQRQAELEAEDRRRRERAEAKKRELEEAIMRREEEKQRAAREASQAALAALAAANAPLPPQQQQQQPHVVPPPPPPPPRVQPPPGAEVPSHTAVGYDAFNGLGEVTQPQTEAAPRRPEVVPAPAPAHPAWTQSLYSRDTPKPPAEVEVVVPPPPPPPRAESSHSTTKSAYQDGWQDECRGDGGPGHVSRDEAPRQRESGRDSRTGVIAAQGRGRGRRGEGSVRATEGRSGRSRPSTSALTTPRSHTPQASSREGMHGDAGSTTASGTPSDADAAAVAAAAKVAKAMEGYALSLPSVLPAKGAGKDAGGAKHGVMNGVHDLSGVALPPLPTPDAQENAPLYSSYGSGAALMPASDAVHTLDRMDKRGGMFDGKEDGEDLLPSNIFGGDDAYSGISGKASSAGVTATRPSPLLPLHDAGFGAPLNAAPGKSVANSGHASRGFTSPDHPSTLPLGSSSSFGAPPQPHQSMHDRLPDEVQLWGRAHNWAPPPPATTLHHSSDLHLHTAPFRPVDVSTYLPSSAAPQQAPTSAAPAFNAFGYPSNAYTSFSMQQPPYALNAVFQQPHQPLLPTSKPPDWSNNAPSSLGWPSVAPPAAGHSGLPSENQPFSMRSTGAHGSFQPNGAPSQSAVIGVAHPHQRLVDVEMKLPDNLGLGAQPVSKVPMAPQARTSQTPPPISSSRGARGNRGNRGGSAAAPPPPPPRSSGGRGDGNQARSRTAETERSNQAQAGGPSSGSGALRRHGHRGGRGRGQGRRGRDRAEAGPAPSANAV